MFGKEAYRGSLRRRSHEAIKGIFTFILSRPSSISLVTVPIFPSISIFEAKVA